jgi:hypothetical protein
MKEEKFNKEYLELQKKAVIEINNISDNYFNNIIDTIKKYEEVVEDIYKKIDRECKNVMIKICENNIDINKLQSQSEKHYTLLQLFLGGNQSYKSDIKIDFNDRECMYNIDSFIESGVIPDKELFLNNNTSDKLLLEIKEFQKLI